MSKMIDFQTDPSKYRHWKVEYEGPVANLIMDVDENGGLFEGYELKLNSYDLGVDIELNDIVQRMRFEHPEVKVVVMKSGKDKVFCAGANIRMLGGAEHSHKVNFCKFTNETRNAFEAAAVESGQNYIAAVRGACAGGGYELALACNHIMLTDDSSSAVGLPEVPLLAVLPGTGGLTRVTDKRKVRRDRADIFCSMEEGIKGKRALEWRLVDEVIANSKFDEAVVDRAKAFAEASDKPDIAQGITLGPLNRSITEGAVSYDLIEVAFDRAGRHATITIKGPGEPAPADMAAFEAQGDQAYMLKLVRELEDVILHLRTNENELGLWIFAAITLTEANFGRYPMGNDITRLQTRFLAEPAHVDTLKASIGTPLEAEEADALGLVTVILDDIDWEDEVRIFIEERVSFSPDAMTGMEANLRFAGPETMETRIFGRLTAWQNWIFNRPNAVGKDGALQRYGTGVRGDYNMERV